MRDLLAYVAQPPRPAGLPGESDLALAVADFNARHPILDVLRSLSLRRTGKEHHGPCPLCGGCDRFCVWPGKSRAWCRRCKATGDALTWAMRLEGLDPGQPGATARYLCERGFLSGGTPRQAPARATVPPEPRPAAETARSTTPINLGRVDPMRAYYADFLRERRAVLVVDGGLSPKQANAEARRLLVRIRARERGQP